VEFDSVPVAADDVLGSLSPDEGVLSPFASLAAPTARLISAQFCLGIAEGLLAEVHEHGRAVRSTWQPFSPQPWPGSLPQDPYTLTVYGELAVVARAASALAEQGVDALLRGLAQGEDLDDEECAEITVLASVAEAAASRAAQEITTRALDVVGVDAPSNEARLRPLLAQRPDPHPARTSRPQAARDRGLLPQRCAPVLHPSCLTAQPVRGGHGRDG